MQPKKLLCHTVCDSIDNRHPHIYGDRMTQTQIAADMPLKSTYQVFSKWCQPIPRYKQAKFVGYKMLTCTQMELKLGTYKRLIKTCQLRLEFDIDILIRAVIDFFA